MISRLSIFVVLFAIVGCSNKEFDLLEEKYQVTDSFAFLVDTDQNAMQLLYQISTLEEKGNNKVKLQKAYENAYAQFPTSVAVQTGYAAFLLNAGRNSAASKVIERGQKMYPENVALKILANALKDIRNGADKTFVLPLMNIELTTYSKMLTQYRLDLVRKKLRR